MKTDFFSEFFIVSDGSIICILFRSAPRAHPCSGHTFAYAAAGASAGASAGAAASPASAGAAATPASAGAAGAPASAGAATGGAGVLPGTSRVIIGSASAERPHWAAWFLDEFDVNHYHCKSKWVGVGKNEINQSASFPMNWVTLLEKG